MFSRDTGNAADWLFSRDLVMTMRRDCRQATFVAVLDMRRCPAGFGALRPQA
jgi:hypothetical protein